MRNWLKLFYLVSLIFSFVFWGCGETTDNANTSVDSLSEKMINDIDSIGEVELEDEELINKLVERYSTLTESQKEQITNYATLLIAQDKLDELKKEEEAAKEADKKDPWDLTGNWCDESVENGKPGMAAYISDKEMILYFVSDKQDIYSPYFEGTYETQQGKESFSWTSTNDVAKDADYPMFSDAETKDFSYKDGVISFVQMTGGQENTVELHRTDLDFSNDDIPIKSGKQEETDLGLFSFKIPSSFGFYSLKESENETRIRYISREAEFDLVKGKTIDGMSDVSDAEFENAFNANVASGKKGILQWGDNSSLIDEWNDSIANCSGYACHIAGVKTGGMNAEMYYAVFASKYSETFYYVLFSVSDVATRDYSEDFKALLNGISASDELNTTMALSSLVKEEDEISRIAYYKPKSYPQYINTRTYVLPYIATKDDKVELHLKFNYFGANWVFWDKAIFAIDDDRYEIYVGSANVNYDISDDGRVVEHYDKKPLSKEEIDILRKIATSEKMMIRFQGDSHKSDFTMTDEDKKAFADVLAAYDALSK